MRNFKSLPEDGFLSAAETAQFLGVSVKTVYQEDWKEQLGAVNIAPDGKRPVWRFPVSRLRGFRSRRLTRRGGPEDVEERFQGRGTGELK